MNMKQAWIILLFALFSLSASAQGEGGGNIGHWRPKYRNLNFNKEKITWLADDSSLDSKFGFSFTTGRTYYLHRNPILRMIRIGVDATWFDLAYTQYKQSWSDYGFGYDDEEEEESTTIHKAEVGVQVGPSVTVNPIGKLNVHAYFRYAPTFAMMYNDAFGGNYASMFVTGASVSYGLIGVGIEKRWGTCKYKEFGGGDDEDEFIVSDFHKIKTSGFRVYLSFRLRR